MPGGVGGRGIKTPFLSLLDLFLEITMNVKIEAGTVFHEFGIPFELTADATAETSEGNYKLFLSQVEHSSLNPVHAPAPDSATTSSESLLSIFGDNESRT